jgi:hypothetical protein
VTFCFERVAKASVMSIKRPPQLGLLKGYWKGKTDAEYNTNNTAIDIPAN